ncbi:cytochrome c oxidase assembly protein [Rhizobium sp. CSW-27]|uniref:cytochrome c oxidase assembly protein n=1 Tax=Rhizobium sp. CSW-27 TaxID=2839985 RepID=UPI001C009A3A|nr:cytochrome c oxidase assembly protein [Rhizobium sp. CSW-27]MBT9369105.1 cytochrome c oxidase assembly protein [Rhizobium sp. CSW-27]
MRRVFVAAGLLLLAAAWTLLALGDAASFSIHMITHMAVVAGAAPLLAIGLSGTRFDHISTRAHMTPLLASMIELVTVWGWHLPALRALSEQVPLVRALEQASFLAAGLVLWLSCFGGGGRSQGERRLGGTLGLLFTSMHMTLLGALLSLAPRPLYGEGFVTCFGTTLSAAEDQQIGGVVMLMVGAAVYLVGGVTLLARTLNAPDAPGLGEG